MSRYVDDSVCYDETGVYEQGCDFGADEGEYKRAYRQARQHSKKTGHWVVLLWSGTTHITARRTKRDSSLVGNGRP